MRTTAFIVVLALIATSQAAYKQAKPFKLDTSAIEATQKKPTVTFSDFVSFFQSHDFNLNDQLSQFLDQLVDQIQHEHQQQLELYSHQREELTAEYAFRQGEIDDATAALAASQDHLNLAQSETVRAQNLLNLALNSLDAFNAQLNDLQVNRAAQIALFNQRVHSLTFARDEINRGINLLDEFEMQANGEVPTSFLQSVNALLAVSVKTGHSNKVLPVYTKLLQSYSRQSFDINDVEEVRDLFNELLANVESALNKLNDQETQNAADFDASVAYLNEVIARLTNQVNQSNTYIATLQGVIDQENSISAQAQGKIQRNTDLLNQAYALGEDCDNEFRQGESTRRTQLELLAQVRGAIQQLEAEYGDSLMAGFQPENSPVLGQ